MVHHIVKFMVFLAFFQKKSDFVEYSTGPEYSTCHEKFFLSSKIIDLQKYFLKYMDLTKSFENIDRGEPPPRIMGFLGGGPAYLALKGNLSHHVKHFFDS